MRHLFLSCLCFISFLPGHNQILLKVRLQLNGILAVSLILHSTIQVGAEIGLNESLTIHCDSGINSNIYKYGYYNKRIFINHNQFRKYKRNGHFYGIRCFLHARKELPGFWMPE